MKSGASTADVYKPNLWYFDLLMFLKDHEIPRSSIGSDCPEFIETLSQVNTIVDSSYLYFYNFNIIA